MLSRQVAACTDLRRQRIVAGRAFDQHAGSRHPRNGRLCSGHRVHDLAVAARHQHFRDGFGQCLALGDGRQMLLALLVGGCNQVGFVETLGGGQHRPRHLDVVVERQRRITPAGEFGTGASRLASLARALASIAFESLPITSSNRLI